MWLKVMRTFSRGIFFLPQSLHCMGNFWQISSCAWNRYQWMGKSLAQTCRWFTSWIIRYHRMIAAFLLRNPSAQLALWVIAPPRILHKRFCKDMGLKVIIWWCDLWWDVCLRGLSGFLWRALLTLISLKLKETLQYLQFRVRASHSLSLWRSFSLRRMKTWHASHFMRSNSHRPSCCPWWSTTRRTAAITIYYPLSFIHKPNI